jgi:hypothetical protein
MRQEMMYDTNGVYIEPIASSSDFSKFIDSENFGFDSNEFWDKMDMWEEGNISNRFSKEWCQQVIDGKASSFWNKKKKYYPAILELMKRYELKTIRFACDW